MKTTIHVHYSFEKYIEGFRIYHFKLTGDKNAIYLGEIEIDNPFDAPDISVLNNAKIENINNEIKAHKAQINSLENQVKDLLCIENKEN